jgi:predicted Zn-dependent peptidase
MPNKKEEKTNAIKLKNDLTIVTKKKEGASITLLITFKVGSINEKDGEKGISHLIEHLLFEGTKKRKNAKIITSEIENLGGEFNAATSNETTSFYIKILNKHYKIALDILADIVMNSTFDKFEKEKKIVLEEMKMLMDNPRYYQWIFFEKNMFENTIYSKPVYGNISDLQNVTKKTLLNYYKKHYVPNNAIISIAGNFNDEIISEVEKKFSAWKGKFTNISPNLPKNKKRYSKETKKIQQTYLTIGFITESITHEDSAVLEIIEAILGKPQSGIIVDEVRNKSGLAYDISIMYENFLKFSFFAVNMGIKPSKKELALRIVKDEFEKMKNGAFSEKEIINAKQYIEGKLLLESEDTRHLAERIAFWQLIQGKEYSDEYLEKIKKVTKQDIVRVAKKYFIDNMTISEICPDKEIKE